MNKGFEQVQITPESEANLSTDDAMKLFLQQLGDNLKNATIEDKTVFEQVISSLEKTQKKLGEIQFGEDLGVSRKEFEESKQEILQQGISMAEMFIFGTQQVQNTYQKIKDTLQQQGITLP